MVGFSPLPVATKDSSSILKLNSQHFIDWFQISYGPCQSVISYDVTKLVNFDHQIELKAQAVGPIGGKRGKMTVGKVDIKTSEKIKSEV